MQWPGQYFRRSAFVFTATVIVLFLALGQVRAAGASALKSLNAEAMPDKVTITINGTGLKGFTAFTLDDPARLVIDLPGVTGRLPVQLFPVEDLLVKQVRWAERAGGVVRIVIDLNYAVPYNITPDLGRGVLKVTVHKLYEQRAARLVTDGLVYKQVRRGTPAGPVVINILDLDLGEPKLTLGSVLGRDYVRGTETVSSLARRHGALAAVNAGYFAPNGEIIGMLQLGSELVSPPILRRTAFALTTAGYIVMDQLDYATRLLLPGGTTLPVAGINRERRANELVIYTPAYGPTTFTRVPGREIAVKDGVVVAKGRKNSAIPRGGYVISAQGPQEKLLRKLRPGQPVVWENHITPFWDDAVMIVGGGPRLVKAGQICVTAAGESFGPDVNGGRAPRTALGVTALNHVLLVTVDGRQPGYSIGATLTELASLLLELGARDAMNLDGGGSTTMVVEGQVVNRPSAGQERSVANALLIIPRERPGD